MFQLGGILCLTLCKVVLCGVISCLGFRGVDLRSGVGCDCVGGVEGEFSAEHGHLLTVKG